MKFRRTDYFIQLLATTQSVMLGVLAAALRQAHGLCVPCTNPVRRHELGILKQFARVGSI
jgi:hypothetical protein